MKTKKHICPGYTTFFNPTLNALDALGGSASNDDILSWVIENMKLPDEVVDERHAGSNVWTELQYQLAWARTYLRIEGYVQSSQRGTWTLTKKGLEAAQGKGVDAREIVRAVNKATASERKKSAQKDSGDEGNALAEASRLPWRERLSEILHAMPPQAFERLTKYLLEECGFKDVRVTGKSGDGGIDGHATLKIENIFSFHVAFQCKRYKGSVGAEIVRNFRGSLDQNIEKGVLITTGSFTRAAKDEAVAPGKKQIDLMDGNEFMTKLAECEIGLRETRDYVIDESFYANWN